MEGKIRADETSKVYGRGGRNVLRMGRPEGLFGGGGGGGGVLIECNGPYCDSKSYSGKCGSGYGAGGGGAGFQDVKISKSEAGNSFPEAPNPGFVYI